jgi:HPt (histidine-containing phosphotransfer) domain-containing protein
MESRRDSYPGSGAAWTLPDELRMLAEAGDADMVREVIRVFQSDTAIRIRAIQEGVARGDGPRVKHEAHAVKGSAAQVGATSLAAICRSVETAALSGASDDLGRLLREMEAEFAAVRSAMADFRL